MNHRLDRFELKFILSAEQRERLMPELLPHLRADENAVTGAHYPVVSVYYDNAERDCYWENLNGAQSRRKLRVRLYGSQCGGTPPTCFAEVKHKVDGRNVKRRARLSIAEALAVAAGEYTPAGLSPGEQRTVQEIHELVHRRGLAPCVCLRYDRHAYAAVEEADDLRITFDTGIAYRFERLTPVPDDRDFSDFLHAEGASVMEVKVTGAVPYWLTRLLGEAGCVMQGHSKYCRIMEAGDPGLRAQRARTACAA
ncbi:MAG TPA: polyphosphate polymerase domain-containing protein [Chthoniobacteraceae bacterium]|nr:polyphosphate polymerase domain-containing protein [Chthoniobacteraceae bacterium]